MSNPERILQHVPFFFKPQYISEKETHRGFSKEYLE